FVKLSQEHGNEIALFTNGKNLYSSLNHPNIKYFISFFQLQHNEQFDKKYNEDILSMTLLNMDSVNPQHFQINPNIHLAPVHLKGLEHSYDVIRKNRSEEHTSELQS